MCCTWYTKGIQMSITYSYANIPVQEDQPNAAMTSLSLSGLSPAAERTEKNGLVKIAEYVLKGTDPAKPTSVSLRQELTKDGGRRSSLRLSTTVTRLDTVTSEETLQQAEVVIAWNTSTPFMEGTSYAAMSRMIQCAVGILMTSYDVSTGIPTNVTLEDTNYGILNDLA